MPNKQRDNIDIVDVARLAGVSAATVSRAFNHPNLVKASTRKRIEKAVQESGYIRNRAAQAMYGKRSGTIGLIVPTINHAIFAEVIQSFTDEVETSGFTILIASHGYDLEKEYAVLRKLLEHRVDGIVLTGLDHSEATYQLISQQGIPAIAIWNYAEDSPISCVGAENRLAGRMAAEHLIDCGHREIGMISPPAKGNDRATDRLAGALAVFEENGVIIPDAWRSEATYSTSEAKSVCLELLSATPHPTALFCGNDVIALGAIFAAQKLGLRTPEDVSIIGIGDFYGSEDVEPSLTTIRIPARRIGKVGGDLICQLIADGSTEIVRHKIELNRVVRNSIKRIARA